MSLDNNDNKMTTSMFLWIVAMVVALFVIPAVYARKAEVINEALLSFSKLQLKSFLPFSEEARQAWERISSADPASLTWANMEGVLRYTGKWIRWPYAVLLALLGVGAIFLGRTSGLVRRLNMESLLRNNAESFACLRPIVGRGKNLLDPASYDAGHWQIARSPAQFALEHGLLMDRDGKAFSVEEAFQDGLADTELPAYGQAHLDEAKTLATLQKQLGKPFAGFEELAPERKALACAFLAYASGDKEGCLSILDAVSISYLEKEAPSCPILSQDGFQKRLTKTWDKHQKILADPLLVRHGAFELPWFMALITRARKKGVLASSQFLWLRPLDRPLWYAIHQCGGRAAWAEAFASWAHYSAEEKAKKPLPEPHLSHAVRRLRDSLASQGWLADTARAAVAPQSMPPVENSTVTPDEAGASPEIVYAAADEEPEEYDANEDQELRQEQF